MRECSIGFVALFVCTAPGCTATPSPAPSPALTSGPAAPVVEPVARAGHPAAGIAATSTAPSPPADSPAGKETSAAPAAQAPTASAGSSHPRATPKVIYIGMHIGGGPNDRATKAPFVAAIDAKLGDLERCAAGLDGPAASGTFGIDLLIAAEGGHPETSNVRTVLSSDDFKKCMATAFESVEFARPKHGKTKLSYALRIEPR